MDYIERIFKRAKLSNIADDILYGPEPTKTSRTMRIE